MSNGSVGSWLTGERALMGDGNLFPLVCVCFQVVLAYEVLCYVSVQVRYLLDNNFCKKFGYWVQILGNLPCGGKICVLYYILFTGRTPITKDFNV